MRGYYIATQIRGKDLSDASFLPVYERIEASGLPLFLHPVEVIGHERLAAYYLTNLLGNPFESAIAAAHLIFGGVLDRFPKLVVCLPHAGGAFAWLVGRLNRGWEKRADLKHVKHAPFEYLRRFYYDTVGYSDHVRSEEHTSELQSPCNLVCRLLLEKKKHKYRLLRMGKGTEALVRLLGGSPTPASLRPRISCSCSARCDLMARSRGPSTSFIAEFLL